MDVHLQDAGDQSGRGAGVLDGRGLAADGHADRQHRKRERRLVAGTPSWLAGFVWPAPVPYRVTNVAGFRGMRRRR